MRRASWRDGVIAESGEAAQSTENAEKPKIRTLPWVDTVGGWWQCFYMPLKMRMECPGAVCRVVNRGGDRREIIWGKAGRIVVQDCGGEDGRKRTRRGCAMGTMPLKWIARRVWLGTSNSANSKLHQWMPASNQASLKPQPAATKDRAK